MSVIAIDNLQRTRPGAATRFFEGEQYGDVAVSFFLTGVPPGKGASRHRHPYAEVFIVQAGLARFTMGATTTDVTEGHIVIIPPDVPHAFVNGGTGVLRQISIHPSPRIITTWMEEAESAPNVTIEDGTT